mgnify:CR=1 FL=1
MIQITGLDSTAAGRNQRFGQSLLQRWDYEHQQLYQTPHQEIFFLTYFNLFSITMQKLSVSKTVSTSLDLFNIQNCESLSMLKCTKFSLLQLSICRLWGTATLPNSKSRYLLSKLFNLFSITMQKLLVLTSFFTIFDLFKVQNWKSLSQSQQQY